MAVTTRADLAMSPEEEVLFEHDRKEQAELEALRGTDDPAGAPETRVLDAILSVAESHDRVCQYMEDKLRRDLGIRGGAHGQPHDDAELNALLFSVIELCAILAPAAMRRIPAPVFAKAVAVDGTIEELQGDELEAFMRPIFEESGIGSRFEVRSGYQVYREREAPAASN